MNTPSFKEDHISQVTALQLLVKMGYQYLTPDEAIRLRYGRFSNVVLEDILIAQLRRINRIRHKGREFPFSEGNILDAVNSLKSFSLADGLIRTNEKVYDLLTLGKSLEQNIEGDKKSFTLKYIDWENPANNTFHVTEEFEVLRNKSSQTYRPDIVLFVNGIPFVIVECKRPDIKNPLDEAISQQLRNQHDEGIPYLYIYSQLLLAPAFNEAKYGTTGTPLEFWAKWKEQFQNDHEKNEYERNLSALKNEPLTPEIKDKLFSTRFRYVKNYFEQLEKQNLLPCEQDRLLYDLCRPDRLLELTYRFIVYDGVFKKIARYQQYFTVKSTVERVKIKEGGKRKGGVIWHTQGSGKSITMVMLAKSIALEKSIRNPRIVLVTDRIDLDDNIYNAFRSCGKEVRQATSGKNLLTLLSEEKEEIITTLIDKFDSAMGVRNYKNLSSEIFVLVDESHRSQYGIANTKMQTILPNACFIGFTGTPVVKKDKNTIAKFGGLINPVYTIDKAVEDKAVVPLLYEGRHILQEVDQKPIDTYFDMVCEPLTPYQKADLKKKFSNADHLNSADQKIYRAAWDISTHFRNEWQGTGFKAQLAANRKLDALKFKEYIDDIGLVTSEVLISGPDDREGYDDIDSEPEDKVKQFWKIMMHRYGNDKKYNKQLINSFKYDSEPEIIIVVDKLLTGFDAPRNTVLYIAKDLHDHSLLQAIARVNRLCEGKEFGYIIDYYGILGNLDQALTDYKALADFDENDLQNTLSSINTEIERLPQLHSQLWDIFKEVRNKRDAEAYERLLADNSLREQFYARLSEFARTLKIALSTVAFIQNTEKKIIDMYREDAKFFLCLRPSVQKRYSDRVDYKQYETQIQRLIDTHIKSDEIVKITDLVNIFETEKFQKEVEKATGTAGKADMIATRTQKTINAKMDEDPAFYKKFSKMLEEVIEEFRQKRISDAEYLTRVKEIMNSVVNRTGDDVPFKLRGRDVAKAFYGISLELLDKFDSNGIDSKELSAETGVAIDDIIKSNLVVDWRTNQFAQNKMRQGIDDYLFNLKETHTLAISPEDIDSIIEKSIEIAKLRY